MARTTPRSSPACSNASIFPKRHPPSSKSASPDSCAPTSTCAPRRSYLQAAGWDAEALLLRRPSLVILRDDAQTAIGPLGVRYIARAMRDAAGVLHLNPAYNDKNLQELRTAADTAHQQVAQLRERITDGAKVGRYALALWTHARALIAAPTAPEPMLVREIESPPDHKTPAWRTKANLQAMQLVLAKEPDEMTSEDLQAVAGYSGWGGLSIEKVKAQIPTELVPETFGLIHEYYTPTVIAESLAEVLCPYLPELTGEDGLVRALEPSAGIGRLIRAFSPRRCLALEAGGQIKGIQWTAVEFSKVSSTLLRALRPDITLHHMPFERWVREYGPHHQGALNLILSNPPYGERGAMAREDPDEVFKEKRAFAYFMRRTLDLLVPSGIGVFLIPAGFMSGRSSRGLREKILLRHHLLGAYRLPSHDTNGREIVPGAFVVMDIVIWRSRGGELREVDADDIYILDGEYFEQHPDQILGDEEGSFAGEDEAGNKKTSWRYKVEGDFRGLPPLQPRPICTSCELTSIAPRAAAGTFQTVVADVSLPNDLDPELRAALELGRRVGRYLAALGADDDTKALALWPELHQALTDHALAYGNPWQHKELLALSNRGQALAQQLLNAYTRMGALVPALRDRPKVEPKYTGQPDDVPAQAEMLFRARRHLTITELLDFHRRQGGTLSRQAALESLFGNGWNLDGDEWNELYPSDAYTTGIHLWERHDRAQARAAAGDAQAAAQVARLIAAIKPVLFQDIQDIGPNQGWVPLELVAAWLSATYNRNYGPILLERHEALVRPIGPDGDKEPTIHPKTSSILGWINPDIASFKVEKPKKRDSMMSREEKKAEKLSLAQLRLAQEKAWTDEFVTWLTEDEERQEAVAAAYNRAARGRVVPTYTTEPLEIARWGANAPQLKPHQVAGARRVLHQRGGLVAFDVGVGKTYTALAIVALARQEGWARRPVILVPGSIVWKWHDDILCTLPDYRIAVIGSKRKRLTRGTRKGQITSETDTPEERAQKWIALQTGQLDVVILSYDALGRTKMNESAVLEYVESVEAIRRSLTLRRMRLNALEDKAKEKLSERQKALLEHGTSAWVDEILALPEGWQYDPGVTWDEIGVDLLIVDEAASFKNLHLPQAREDGSIPKFMGSGGGEGSGRAWQLDFRAGAVRRQTGGSGVVLLTATPAKNSPLGFTT
ncbi:MAG: DEAD/DEAH box helicase family protein [Nannocystis sp.]|nr:DEAD/DEAH box helicase family protein [Nannocystis sp.]